jgi:hypothetical protein
VFLEQSNALQIMATNATNLNNIEQVVIGLEVTLNDNFQQNQYDPCKQFINQKRIDDNFHKYKLVQRIVALLKEELSSEIDEAINYERITNIITNQFSEGEAALEFSKTTEFQNLLEKILAEVDAAVSLSSFEGGERVATPLSIPSASGWDPIVEQSANLFDDCVMVSSAQRKQLALDLEPWNDTEVRRNAIQLFCEMTPVDIVPNEHWDLVIKSLSLALSDPEPEYASN